MHSVNDKGMVCINLDDYNAFSNSIKHRYKIQNLLRHLKIPAVIHYFSVTIVFRNNHRYYISNMDLWSVPYHTEGYFRVDIDHDKDFYNGKEFFLQRSLTYDAIQTSILQILESRYKIHTLFAMVRQCPECDFIIEAYHPSHIVDPVKLYYQEREAFEGFIVQFLDAMQEDIRQDVAENRWTSILTDARYRKSVLTRQNQAFILHELSRRERECLQLLAQGKNAKEIARCLQISPETINTHAKSIRKKMDCKNITQAAVKAVQFGWL